MQEKIYVTFSYSTKLYNFLWNCQTFLWYSHFSYSNLSHHHITSIHPSTYINPSRAIYGPRLGRNYNFWPGDSFRHTSRQTTIWKLKIVQIKSSKSSNPLWTRLSWRTVSWFGTKETNIILRDGKRSHLNWCWLW